MKVIDFKEQYTKIKPGEYFVALDGDQWFVDPQSLQTYEAAHNAQ